MTGCFRFKILKNVICVLVPKCATLFTAYPSYKNGDISIDVPVFEPDDMNKMTSLNRLGVITPKNWVRKVSYVEVEPKCIFEGFQGKDHQNSLGKWRGRLTEVTGHEMDPEYENDAMKSFKCQCFPNRTCTDLYNYNQKIKKGCSEPLCDIAQPVLHDAWKKKVLKIDYQSL